MLGHLVFTGSVKNHLSIFVERDSIGRIQTACKSLNVGGCMFYADGNYLLILEGVRENLQTLFQKFSKHPSLRAPLILVDNEAEGRHFEAFNISFLPRNMEEPIEDAIFLNKSTPEQLIPAQYPENVKLIVDSFLQVQRVA